MNEYERMQNGIDKFQHIAKVQVDWRMTNGGKDIERDNTAIWDGFLHRLTNDDWFDILCVFPMITKEHHVFLRSYQDNGYERCCKTLERYWDTPRCLDIKNSRMDNKRIQWQMIMIIREVYETINNTQYPKVPQSTAVPKSAHKFNELFE
jgi:hypothetical protein